MPQVEESRQRKRLYAPPRVNVQVPGRSEGFRGALRRVRENGCGGCFLGFFCLFGLSFCLFGVAGTAGPWRDGLRENGDPRFFYAAMAIGAVFFLVALRMFQISVTSPGTPRRPKGMDGAKPWTADHPWRPEGMDPDYSTGAGGYVLGRIAFLALIALFNIPMGDPGAPLLLKGIVLLFDLFGLLIVYDSFQKLWQSLRHSRPRIVWQTFPALTGSRLEAVFRPARPIRPRGPIRATLRCLQDEWTEQANRASQLEAFITYEQIREIPVESETIDSARLAFDVPEDLPGTNLFREDAIYWQVLVQVPVTGPDFEAVFLAPVYRR